MIQSKIIKDTLNAYSDDRIVTFELVLPKYLVAEVNKHTVLHNSCQSSRAVPVAKMIQSVEENPFIPYYWQKPHKGMQGYEYYTNENKISQLREEWLNARDNAVITAKKLQNEVSKQTINRLLEPFMYVKMVLTGTEFGNFFNQRCPIFLNNKGNKVKSRTGLGFGVDFTSTKGQADIHLQILAEMMHNEMYYNSNPVESFEHIPYDIGKEYPLEARLHYSASQCARISFTTITDDKQFSLERNLQLAQGLIVEGHAEPFSHQAIGMNDNTYNKFSRTFLKDLTDDEPVIEYGWCRKMRGWVSHRHLLGI